MTMFPKKYPDENAGSPSQDNTKRYPTDQLLRKFGYVIHSRPKEGQAIWAKRGKLFTQEEAILESRRVSITL